MELRWYRDKPSPAVHVYKNGEDVYNEQMTEYKGRTSFNGNHMTRGEAAVKIHNVTVFDNGTYHCVFKEYTSHSQATLWLKVAGEVWCGGLPLPHWGASLSVSQDSRHWSSKP